MTAVVLTLLFTLCVAIIHAQPVNDDDLRAFVMPPAGCDQPCWQGLQPGVTDIFTIMSTLRQNAWVSSVHHENYTKFSNGFVRWQWSEFRPSFIHHTDLNNLWYSDSVAQDFRIFTHVSLGEMILLLGKPDWMITRRMNVGVVEISAWYGSRGLMVGAVASCSGGLLSVWHARSSVTWMHELPRSERSHPPGGSAVLGAVATCR
jgi:hypothetical protein